MMITTKLTAPRSGHTLLLRNRLTHYISEITQLPLVMVYAPAGFSKTTALTQWLNLQSKPYAWLTIDQHDNDETRFWQYLYHSLRATNNKLQPLEVSLDGSQLPEWILSQIDDDSVPRFLILDDFHCLQSQKIKEGLGYFIHYLPKTMTLVLCGRAKPSLPLDFLSPTQIGEVTEQQLRFTKEETIQLLSEVSGTTPLPNEVDALYATTHGWPAAVRLMTLSGKPLSVSTINLSPTNISSIDSLFAAQLQSRTADIMELLSTAAFFSRFSIPLCQHLHPSLDIQSRLQALYEEGLFITTLDAQSQWFKFHDLFRDYLLRYWQQKPQEESLKIRQEGAQWLETHNYHSDAIEQYLAISRWDKAAKLIEMNGDQYVFSLRANELYNLIRTLPQHILTSRPILLLQYIRTTFHLARYIETEQSIDSFIRLLNIADAEKSDEELKNIGFISRDRYQECLCEVRFYTMFFPSANTHLLENATQDYPANALTLLAESRRILLTGQFIQGRILLEQGFHIAKNGDNIVSFVALSAMYSWLENMQAEPEAAFKRSRAASQILQQRTVNCAPTFDWLALIDCLGYKLVGDFHRAFTLTEHLLSEEKIQGDIQKRSLLNLLNAHMHIILGRYDAAEQLLITLRAVETKLNIWTQSIPSPSALYTLLSLQQGRTPTDELWIENLKEETGLLFRDHTQRFWLARLWLHANELEKAENELLELLSAAQSGGQWTRVHEVNLLISITYFKQGKLDAGKKLFRSTLKKIYLAGIGGILLEAWPLFNTMMPLLDDSPEKDYLLKLLKQYRLVSSTISQPPPLPLENLSQREVEILRLINSGYSNGDIAKSLGIALPTVKAHLRNIFSKLDVKNRTMAAAKAREWQLIP